MLTEIVIGEVKMLLGDGRDFQTDETFDVVVFSECIEHLGEVETIIAHYRPNLKAGGAVGLTMWLALKPLRLWHRLKAMGEVLDEVLGMLDCAFMGRCQAPRSRGACKRPDQGQSRGACKRRY